MQPKDGRKPADKDYRLTVKDGRISLQATGAKVKTILHAISKETGIRISYNTDINPRINISLQDMPVGDAIRKLFENNSMVYTKSENEDIPLLTEVFITDSSLVEYTHNSAEIDKIKKGASLPEALHEDLLSIPLNGGETSGLPPVVPDELIVSFYENVPENEIRELIESTEAKIKSRIKPFNDYVITLPAHVPIEAGRKWFAKQHLVQSAEPNYHMQIQQLPNDLLFPFQWALYNNGRIGGHPFVDIDADRAWEIHTGSPNVVIAVVDTGIDYSHSDIARNIWHNMDEIPGNGVDDDRNGYVDDRIGWDFVDASSGGRGEDFAIPDNDPMDRHGHGTLVAGIIGAVGNNRFGIAGTAWNCRLMPVRAGYRTVSGGGILESDDAARAIIYAALNGAHIINLSWGSSGPSILIEKAIRLATDNGVLVCAAAGNQNTDLIRFPARMDNAGIIAVGSTDATDKKASFSNYGQYVDVFAPGETIYTIYMNNQYAMCHGTSLSTAFAAGVAGLIRSLNPALNHLQVKDIILNSADFVQALTGLAVSSGRINAYRALIMASKMQDS